MTKISPITWFLNTGVGRTVGVSAAALGIGAGTWQLDERADEANLRRVEAEKTIAELRLSASQLEAEGLTTRNQALTTQLDHSNAAIARLQTEVDEYKTADGARHTSLVDRVNEVESGTAASDAVLRGRIAGVEAGTDQSAELLGALQEEVDLLIARTDIPAMVEKTSLFTTTLDMTFTEVNPPDPVKAHTQDASGSAIFIARDLTDGSGYLLTNYHNVQPHQSLKTERSFALFAPHSITRSFVEVAPSKIVVTFQGGEKLEAEVYVAKNNQGSDVPAVDEKRDLAILKTKGKIPDGAVPAKFSTDPVKQGEVALVYGNPAKMGLTASVGIVSNNQDVGVTNHPFMSGARVLDFKPHEQALAIFNSNVVELVGTDAPVIGGNSGGPMTNDKSEVVAVVTLGGPGHSFGVATSEVVPFVNRFFTTTSLNGSYAVNSVDTPMVVTSPRTLLDIGNSILSVFNSFGSNP